MTTPTSPPVIGRDLEREAWTQRYAEASGVTVQWLLEHGRVADDCDCGGDVCEEFQMRHMEDWDPIKGEWTR
jgi:hypothetical protein